ncbi:hypothetical protein J6590_037727 [Homalodisca vitripennis]|nr:hypothetical protein J6590_037727 [Homalodisca vitripennis]
MWGGHLKPQSSSYGVTTDDSNGKDTLNFSVSQATESRLTSPTMGVIHITNNAATVVLIDVGRTPQTAVSQATESRLTTPTMGVIHITDNSATVVLIDVGRTPQTSQSVKLRSHD